MSRGRRLTGVQERRRIEGLRILTRIIARHRLAHPELYGDGSAADSIDRSAAVVCIPQGRDAA